jgi:dolichol-phosphate mannosyltransferase
MPVHDATAGYRAYRASALRAMGLHDVASQGYCFQVDLTTRAVRGGLRVVEVPITFVEREIGDSKMSGDIMRESLQRITVWGLQYRAHQLRAAGRRLSDREPTWHRL